MAPIRRVPFPERSAGKGFNDKFRELVSDLLRHEIDQVIPPENSQALYHGRSLNQKRPDGTHMEMEIQSHNAETTLTFEDIIRCRFSVLSEQVVSIVHQMHDGIMQSMYARLSEGVEKVGNVVDGKGKPPTETYLEVLRKIELTVNRGGEVSMPRIHAAPEVAATFAKALATAGPEFQAEVERLTKEKQAQALEAERVRLSRFKTQTDAQ